MYLKLKLEGVSKKVLVLEPHSMVHGLPTSTWLQSEAGNEQQRNTNFCFTKKQALFLIACSIWK